jgi:hypothetical protein
VTGKRRWIAVLLGALAAALALGYSTWSEKSRAAISSVAIGRPCGALQPPPAIYRHVVWIVMENKAASDVIGSASAPFENRLAHQCGLATNFSAESHPSLPNYIAMTSGAAQGITDDGDPSVHPLVSASIFSQLGSRWRVLAESMPSNCALSDSGSYAVRHNPATYYTGVRQQCFRQDVPLTKSPHLSGRFTFIAPNLCHDTHDCSTSTGDRWLSGFIPKILNGSDYRSGATAVFITWDEGENNGSTANHVPTIVVSPYTRRGSRSSRPFNHYSLLRTTEEMLGIATYLGHAASAPSMRSAFHL